ncbi:MAG: DmsC/YnfH family molybdoenzyme membrane anchor subunit [Planctomycetota bacterium]
MSTTLPVVNRDANLIDRLLEEQQSLSAVEQFSRWHEAGESATTPAQEKYYKRLLPASVPMPGQQLAFEVDLDACSGCKACVVACHTLNGLEENESWRRVGTLVIGDDTEQSPAAIQHVTSACHHCEDPGCLNGCPVKAYDKDPVTGIVRHLDDQCIGCKYCTMMCPYEVPQYSDRLGIVRKCDLCHQRLSVGEAPACVQSCPNEAIRITVVSTETQVFSETDAVVPTAPKSNITRPTTAYTRAQSLDQTKARPQDENVDEVAESHWPLALMLVATQVSVGMLVAETLVATVAWLIGTPLAPTITLATAIAAFLIGNAGLAIAPLHLGQPLRMWRVFLGLRTSWLSREAVVLGKYMGALSIAIALYSMPILRDAGWLPGFMDIELPSWLGRTLLLISVPLGLVGLYCSAMIYIATGRQLWRWDRTIPRFFGTAALGGTLAGGMVLAMMGASGASSVLCLCAAAIGFWKLSHERSVYSSASDGDDYDRRSRQVIRRYLSRPCSLRLFFGDTVFALSAAAGAFGFFSPTAVAALSVLAFVSLLIGESLERLLYFQSVVYDRMPRTL